MAWVGQVSAHALHRWRQRVHPEQTLRQARASLDAFIELAVSSPRPRRWVEAHAAQQRRFLYLAAQPGIALLVQEDVVVTVITKRLRRDPVDLDTRDEWDRMRKREKSRQHRMFVQRRRTEFLEVRRSVTVEDR